MIYDKRTTFGEDFDLDQETGTYLMTNQVDSSVVRDLGNGQPLYLVVVVTETFTDGGDAATLTLRLVSDDTASIHASTSTIHYQSDAFLKAAMTAGTTLLCVPLPLEGNAYERYLGVNCVVGTAGFDAGMITAFLTLDPTGWKAYPDATN